MSSTLSEGVRVPDIGSTSWGADVNFNWGLLNTALANISGNVKVDVANTWTAPQTFTETISGSIDGVAARAVGDEDGTNIKSALATKAADADVVHKAGAETITGDKTWTGAVVTHNITPETTGIYSLGSSGSIWDSVYANTVNAANAVYTNTAWVQSVRAPGTSNTLILAAMETWEDGARIFMNGKDNANGSVIYADIDHNDGNHSKTGVVLDVRGFHPAGVSKHLGLADPAYKWLTFNGINPGALSLPSHSVYIDISSSITHTDWTVNYYTPTINGYIALNINGCAIIQPYGVYGISAGFYDGTIRINDLRVCLPVIANQQYEIWVLGTVNEARLLPCLGNV